MAIIIFFHLAPDQELAAYLEELDADDDKYNQYFQVNRLIKH